MSEPKQPDQEKAEAPSEEELSQEELSQAAGGITFVYSTDATSLINETGALKYINEQMKQPVAPKLINET